ncbi:MAG: CDC48 family AAA ATPase [Candidatus Aenigmatarchaeota archaeon]
MGDEKGTKDIKLKVGELTGREDFGRGITRIDSATMKVLGVKEGDLLEIEGKRKTSTIAVRAYPADVGLNVVRIDGLVRNNAGAPIGEHVIVRKADIREAKKVCLAPAEKGISYRVSPSLIGQNIFRRPVTKGDIILPKKVFRLREDNDIADVMSMFGLSPEVFIPSDVKLIVLKTEPAGSVQITEMTELEVLPEAAEIKELERVPMVTYEDLGGLGNVVPKIREMIELPLRHPEVFSRLGVEPPKGVLLHGPPGCGKTLLAKAVANESGAHFISLAGPEIMSKWYGQSEENLRKVFDDAEKNAPSIIFIDEVDSIAPKREEVTGEVERRVVSQLLTVMDGLKSRGKVVVIAATNRPNAIDPALRRPGRFDREIEIPVPDKKGRKEVLQIHTRNMPLEKGVDIDKLAEITYGFVGADLSALAKEAAMHSLKRVLPEITDLKENEPLPKELLEKIQVTKEDFEYAMRMVQPSAMREVLVEVPKVKWADVGGLPDVKGALKEAVEWPLKDPESFKRIGIRPSRGIMLYGPPGCGKTFIVKALANESGTNFISIKGPELLSKWVGESEQHIRDIFRRAKQVAPCIVFFDEIDALAPRRGMDVGSRVTEQVVSQLLTEMSGIEEMEGVVIIAATNRPDIVDPALLRPGRFDRLIYVPAPDTKTRLEIMKIHTRGMPLKEVDLEKLAEKADGYSGADLEALVREAGMNSLRENIKAKEVTKKQFDEALKKVKPSITEDMFAKYQRAVEDIKKTKLEESEKMSRYVG